MPIWAPLIPVKFPKKVSTSNSVPTALFPDLLSAPNDQGRTQEKGSDYEFKWVYYDQITDPQQNMRFI